MTRELRRGDVVYLIPQDTRGLRHIWRIEGHKEFRKAAMRRFAELATMGGVDAHAAQLTMNFLNVDDYLTPDEIAKRERAP